VKTQKDNRIGQRPRQLCSTGYPRASGIAGLLAGIKRQTVSGLVGLFALPIQFFRSL
jgi:hypothetical protein